MSEDWAAECREPATAMLAVREVIKRRIENKMMGYKGHMQNTPFRGFAICEYPERQLVPEVIWVGDTACKACIMGFTAYFMRVPADRKVQISYLKMWPSDIVAVLNQIVKIYEEEGWDFVPPLPRKAFPILTSSEKRRHDDSFTLRTSVMSNGEDDCDDDTCY